MIPDGSLIVCSLEKGWVFAKIPVCISDILPQTDSFQVKQCGVSLCTIGQPVHMNLMCIWVALSSRPNYE